MTDWDKYRVIMAGAYTCICFVGSFRGQEVFLVELDGLIKHNDEVKKSNRGDYVIIPLLRRIKGETGEQYHLTPMAAEKKVWHKSQILG